MSSPAENERRQYPRFPCAAPIRISLTSTFEPSVLGECREVCHNGLRIETTQPILVSTQVALRSLSLGLTGRGIVRYCHSRDDKFLIGLEFSGGLHWHPPDQAAAENTFSQSMTPRTAAIFQELLGGASARELQPSVDTLSEDERDILFCTAACIQAAVAATCQARADEIEGLLAQNNQRLPVHLLPI